MEKLAKIESERVIGTFLKTIKAEVVKDKTAVEFFKLTLQVPYYEMLNCAFIQRKDKKKGLLYEALTNRYFFLEVDSSGKPSLVSLSKLIGDLIPGRVREKMFWVCGNKADKVLEPGDFGADFELKKGL